MPGERKIQFLPPGEGNAYWVAGDVVIVKLRGEDTMGAYGVVEVICPPGGGPPPHIHHRDDEAFYVIEGEFEFLAADRTVRASAGAVVHGPKGIPHTYKNVGPTNGRIPVVASPPGFERFVAEVGAPAPDATTMPPPPSPAEIEKLLAVCPKYGIEILPPPRG